MDKLQIIKSKCKNQKTTILNPGQWGLHIKNRYIILQSPKSRTLGGRPHKIDTFSSLVSIVTIANAVLDTTELCFFLLFTSYIFSSCLRVAYALPTPLRCFPTRGLFVLICLRVPTLTSCFLILPTRLACVASVGFLLVLILHILPTRWAQMIESTSNIL